MWGRPRSIRPRPTWPRSFSGELRPHRVWTALPPSSPPPRSLFLCHPFGVAGALFGGSGLGSGARAQRALRRLWPRAVGIVLLRIQVWLARAGEFVVRGSRLQHGARVSEARPIELGLSMRSLFSDVKCL